MFLGGDPSYVQKDKELIEALGLNLKHVTAGAEPAQVARWTQALQAEEAGALLLVHAAVPEPGVRSGRGRAAGAQPDCKDDAKAGGDVEQYKCAYDVTVINKLFSKEFAESGSPAFDVLKKMTLTNEDQEAVAKAIAGDKEDPEKAAKEWVADNEDKVQSWLQ